jgi:WD40 repeat protein
MRCKDWCEDRKTPNFWGDRLASFSPDGTIMISKTEYKGEIRYWDLGSLQRITPPLTDASGNPMLTERIIFDRTSGWFRLDTVGGPGGKLWWVPMKYRTAFVYTDDGRCFASGDDGQLLVIDWSKMLEKLRKDLQEEISHYKKVEN